MKIIIPIIKSNIFLLIIAKDKNNIIGNIKNIHKVIFVFIINLF